MNWPDAVRIAEAKGGQLSRAQECGLAVPRSIITSDLKKVEALLREPGVKFIAKCVTDHRLSSGSIYSTPLELELLSRERNTSRACPMLVQEYVPKKVEIRAVVIGDTVFAAEIHSQEDSRTTYDWRRYGPSYVTHRKHCLPLAIEDSLITQR
jgi:glutathione synthase/RimK-type ligase-like ATP-grasp enzyme